MIDRNKWSAPTLVFATPNNALEDFSVFNVSPAQYEAYYCSGPDLVSQRVYRTTGPTPLGPFAPHDPSTQIDTDSHTRLYRGRMSTTQWLITAITTGLPKGGIWSFTSMPFGIVKRQVINPTPNTAYSHFAGNPAVIHDGAEYNIFFEGCTSEIVHGGKEYGPGSGGHWQMFHATWSGGPAKDAKVDPVPLFRGANPSIALFNGTYYLYYSKWVAGGFQTWCMTQPK